MILVTGATGTVGREVVRRLPPDGPVRILTRRPDRAGDVADHIEVAVGDYGETRSLERALRGVRRVFLVTAGVGGDDDERFLRAARAADVRLIVKLSAAAVTNPGADDAITRWQRRCEALLRASGTEWTLLRPRAFMSNTLAWAPLIASGRPVSALYGTSLNSCVDPRDIADVAVRTLTEEGHEGRAYTLTGPEAVSAAQQTACLAELLGRPVPFEELDPARARAAYLRRYPEHVAEALLLGAEQQRDGAKARVEQTVREVTGRPARSYAEWAADHLRMFGSGVP
ncbi:NAD(P)H-binding protein [Streptomyces ovatisporus]|uniref:NAD(P)H-binding protein n=1 Tax=Streptomyces ovatisporus TaxID=1128682 RepID=A0ABV9AD28_9ACTN